MERQNAAKKYQCISCICQQKKNCVQKSKHKKQCSICNQMNNTMNHKVKYRIKRGGTRKADASMKGWGIL